MHIPYQTFLPQHGLSRLAGWIANCRKPWLKNKLIHSFIRYYSVDMTLAQEEDPSRYANFNQFFIRTLKPEKRPISTVPKDIVSPVDGEISQIGTISKGQLIQAKKINYDLQALLGGDSSLATKFKKGKFATFYLSPRDYHRVHIPYTGTLKEMLYIPGCLFSVNIKSTTHLKNLFVRNERIVTLFSTPIGPMAVILIGAMLVANISTVWEGIVVPASKRSIYRKYYEGRTILLKKGQELGHFQLGSTVIILFSANRMTWLPHIQGKATQFGQCIGRCLPNTK